MTSSPFSLIPAPSWKYPWGVQAGISLDSRLRGSERAIRGANHLLCVAGVRAMIAAVNIGIMFFGLPYRRMARGVIAKANAVFFRWIPSAPHLVNLMFTSRLRVFVNTVIGHVIFLFKGKAGLTCEPVNGSKKYPYLFSAPTLGLMQDLEMLESSRRQPWRFVFPNVTTNADSEKTMSLYLKHKIVHICSTSGGSRFARRAASCG